MTTTQQVRHVDGLVNMLLKEARNYRAANGLYAEEVTVRANAGIMSQLSERDLQHLSYCGVSLEVK